MELDLAIRGGTVVTAADTLRATSASATDASSRSAERPHGAARRSTRPGCWSCPAASTATSTSRSPPAPAS